MSQKIQEHPLPLFLREIYRKGLSGAIYLGSGDYKKILFFTSGKLAFAQSSRFDEKLLVILHLVGKISEEQYNFISGLHQFPDLQVGEILLQHRFVSKKELYYTRIYQFRRIALSTFFMREGKWVWKEDEPLPVPDEVFEIPLAGILCEGARAIDRISFYASKWLFYCPRPLGGIPEEIAVYFTEAEAAFFARLRECGTLTCREIISRHNLQPIDFWRKLLAFYLLGALEMEKSQRRSDISRDIAELLALHKRILAGEADELQLLGISPESSGASIEEAQAHFLARFSPERFGSAESPQIKRIAAFVCSAIENAGFKMAVPSLAGAPAPLAPLAALAAASSKSPAAPRPQKARSSADFTAEARRRGWELYLKGKELYEQRAYADAIVILKHAVGIDGTQADFFHLLGLCQSEIEPLHAEAESSLMRAIELKPWSADPVYHLGVLYRSDHKLDLAERCFERVKEISQEHSAAGRALVDLRRMRSAKKDRLAFLKKKFF